MQQPTLVSVLLCRNKENRIPAFREVTFRQEEWYIDKLHYKVSTAIAEI